MKLEENTDDRLFREEAREWLSANVPSEARPEDEAASMVFDAAWQQTQYDGGWAGVNWPAEYGGRGLSGYRQMIWLQEYARAGAPPPGSNYTGLNHAGPTLIMRGSEEQKARHLLAILKGEEFWCQGFSEPNAGSDLANMRTKGEIDGDEIVVNGHKTWTSNGSRAVFQELVVRTEAGSTRHRGLTWLICDMRAPGISLSPIGTMFGESEIHDTFYEDVRIPLANVVGEVGDGWSVAMSTLSFERGTGFINQQIAISEMIEKLIELARRTPMPDGRRAIEVDSIAERLAWIKAQSIAIKSFTLSILNGVDNGAEPGPEGSMMKVLVTTVYKHLFEAANEILGPAFLEFADSRPSNEWTYNFLYSWVYTIAGGANEIQRDIIADRALGLPRAR